MMQLLERFVVAVENYAAAIDRQTEALLTSSESADTLSTETKAKRTRKTKAEIEAEKAAAAAVPDPLAAPAETPSTEDADFLGSPPEEKKITEADLNDILKKCATNGKVGLAKTKAILSENSGGKNKISEADPATWPKIFKAATEALNAAS
jgi:hypothetical protein